MYDIAADQEPNGIRAQVRRQRGTWRGVDGDDSPQRGDATRRGRDGRIADIEPEVGPDAHRDAGHYGRLRGSERSWARRGSCPLRTYAR
jgi:hypothetical protein